MKQPTRPEAARIRPDHADPWQAGAYNQLMPALRASGVAVVEHSLDIEGVTVVLGGRRVRLTLSLEPDDLSDDPAPGDNFPVIPRHPDLDAIDAIVARPRLHVVGSEAASCR